MGGNVLVQMSVIAHSTELRTEAVLSRHLLFELYNPSSVSTRIALQAVSHMFEAMVP
jgi:hypothetical protein